MPDAKVPSASPSTRSVRFQLEPAAFRLLRAVAGHRGEPMSQTIRALLTPAVEVEARRLGVKLKA